MNDSVARQPRDLEDPAAVPTTFPPHRVGGVELTPLYDTSWQFVPREFLPSADPREWQDATGGPPDRLFRSRVLCFLLRSERSTILVDSGVGDWEWWPYERSHLLDSLAHVGVKPSDIDVVALTHLHPDHAGGAISSSPGGPVPTFVNARYVVSRSDWEWFIAPRSGPVGVSPMVEEALRTSARPLGLLGVLELVELDHELTPEVRLIATPGHTPGALAVQVMSAGQAAFLIGDVAHHPAQLRRPDWGARNDHDPVAAASSRAGLVREAIRLQALVGAAHFGATAPPMQTFGP